MKKNERKRTQGNMMAVTVTGAVLILLIAGFCYRTVKNTIAANERESIESIARVSAHSLERTLEAKRNLVYAAFSGDLEDENAVRQNMLKVGERGKYIRAEDVGKAQKWEREACREAARNPGEVVFGPTVHLEEDFYALYMTKAVYREQSLTGFVQMELNLDEIFDEEQALSSLRLGKNGYCIVKDRQGITIMASGEKKREEILLEQKGESGIEFVWAYEIHSGVPRRSGKLVSYSTAKCGGESYLVCMVEDYNEIVAPVNRIAVYLTGIGCLLLCWLGFFSYRMLKENQEQMLRKYNHSQTMAVLSGSIAHEFNNLMTPIVLYTELLRESDAAQAEMPEEIEELSVSVGRCEELARQLLDYSRLGRARKVLAVYNATYAVQSSVNMVERILPANIRLERRICAKRYEVKGQTGAIHQIILNLVTNAVHAIGERPGVIRISFGINSRDERMLRLVVEDDGGGISEEVRRHIFEPFFTTKEEKEGTGIGLPVVRRLVEESGGMIRVESELGKGTTFFIDFPQVSK